MGWKDAAAGLVSRYGFVILAVSLLVTALSAAALLDFETGKPTLEVDPSVERLLSEEDEETQFYALMRRLFGSDQVILAAIESDKLFLPESLQLLKELTDDIERIPGVLRVLSLANALMIEGTDYGIDVVPFMEAYSGTAADAAKLKDRILRDPLYAGTLVSRDGRTAAIFVFLEDSLSFDALLEVDRQLRLLLKREIPESRLRLTGIPHVHLETTALLLNDLRTMPLIIVLVVAAVLALSFRSLTGVAVPLATVLVSVACTMATVVLLGYSLNIVTVLVPPLLIILGLSYSVHVVSEYHETAVGRDSVEAAAETVRRIVLPVVLTGVTTGVGFLSLVLSPLAAVREFGLFSVIGVLYATFFSLTLTPALMQLTHRLRGRAPGARDPERESAFDRLVSRVALFDTRHRRPIYLVAGVAVLVSLFGMSRIEVGMETISNFDRDSPVWQDFDALNRQLEVVNPLYVVVDADYRDAFKQTDNLKSLQELQRWLGEQPEVGGTTSIADYLMLINSALHENDPAQHAIPDDRRLISQLFFIGSSDETERLVDSRFQVANIMVSVKVMDSADVLELVERIRERLGQLPEHLSARVTGYPVLVNQVVDNIIRGQAQSVFTALVIVYLILVGLFLSFKVGFIALVPNLVPVVLYFGVLGLCGISLNPSTSLIAPMVLGIAIDDTIHYMARFNSFAKTRLSLQQAAEAALNVVGRPVTYTSLGLCLGFLVLTTSELRMQAQVGLMASLALVIAWFSDFFLTPALCSRLRIATIWDVLSIDLGARPQEAFPLFKGLSNFQARIFARMMDITEVEAGRRIIHKGEVGSQMYAVIDGRLQASIEGKSGRIQLDEHRRGDLLGEAGLFFAERTADVDVLEDSRLLCITQDSLKLLGRRYPRIAAKVYRNLNEVLALRLVHATERI